MWVGTVISEGSAGAGRSVSKGALSFSWQFGAGCWQEAFLPPEPDCLRGPPPRASDTGETAGQKVCPLYDLTCEVMSHHFCFSHSLEESKSSQCVRGRKVGPTF